MSLSSKKEKMAVDRWNSSYSVGQSVKYWPITRRHEAKVGKTKSAASLMGGHTAVVFIEGHSGCVALSHVQAV